MPRNRPSLLISCLRGGPRDVRAACRRLAREPRFTLAAVATLAVCLGANLAIFAVVDGVLLRPLPFPDADRLVTVYNIYPGANVLRDESSVTNYYERRGGLDGFTGVAVQRTGTGIVGEPGQTAYVSLTRVSPEFFDVLGVRLAAGRSFTEDETRIGADNVAVLTDGLRRDLFDDDASAVGRQIRVDGISRTVVGVLPRTFRYLSSDARLYLPVTSDDERRSAAARHWGSAVTMIGRLAPGVGIEQAQAAVDLHNARMSANSPSPGEARMAEVGFRSVVANLHDDHVASVRPVLLLVMAGVLLLLMVGAVNLTNLLLVRASARERDIAIRRAIGATGFDVARSIVVETVVLTVAGGLLGLGVAAAGLRVIAALGLADVPLGATVAFDARMAVAAVVAALATGLFFAVPVAWSNLRDRLTGSLLSDGRSGGASRATLRLRHGFVVGQVVLAFVLLCGAGLLARSFENATAVEPGFDASRVATGRVVLPGRGYPDALSRIALADRLIASIARSPGVTHVGVATNVPLSGSNARSAARPLLDDGGPEAVPRGIYSYGVSGAYFETLDVPLRAGRLLSAEDSRRSLRVAVVDEAFAALHWPGRSALGQRFFQGGQQGEATDAFTVVGVVGEVRQAAVTEEPGQGAVYYPYRFRADGSLYIVVRTMASPDALGPVLQAAVRTVDPELPVTDVRTMASRLDSSLVGRRSPAVAVGAFAAIALLLTAIGTYGVLSYAIAQRRREIGLRLALGALPSQIRSQFLRVAWRLFGLGLCLGLPAAWLTGRAMQSMLFDVPALPVGLTVLTAIALGAIVTVAAWGPSRRAARIEPMDAIRET